MYCYLPLPSTPVILGHPTTCIKVSKSSACTQTEQNLHLVHADSCNKEEAVVLPSHFVHNQCRCKYSLIPSFSPTDNFTEQKIISFITMNNMGHAVAQLVEALRYKPEGRGLDSGWCHWIVFIDIILPAAPWLWG